MKMAERVDGGPRSAAPNHGDNLGAVRRIRLTRRRTRVPWIYLVYHAQRRASARVRRSGRIQEPAAARRPNQQSAISISNQQKTIKDNQQSAISNPLSFALAP
jgi:hypothetical protein